MERDALLLVVYFFLAMITFNWSGFKIAVAQFKAKRRQEKQIDPQEET